LKRAHYRELWDMGDLYDAVTRHAEEVSAKARRDAKIAKLIKKLSEN
jgi:hypothetical protein